MDEEPKGWLLPQGLCTCSSRSQEGSSSDTHPVHSLLLPRSLCTCQLLREALTCAPLPCFILLNTIHFVGHYLLICRFVHYLSPLPFPEHKGFIFFIHFCTKSSA